MKKTNSWNRLLSLVLCICMVLSLLPGYALPALAEEAEPTCTCTVKCGETADTNCAVCSAAGADLSAVCTAEPANAEDGVVEVSTEAELVEALENGGNIMLTGDIIVSDEYPFGYDITKNTAINLNGHTITGEGVFCLSGYEENIVLTISGNGTIKNTDPNFTSAIDGFGTLNILGGTIEGGTNIFGPTIMSDGWVDQLNTDKHNSDEDTSSITGGCVGTLNCWGGIVTISGGHVEALGIKYGRIIISGGTFGFDPTAYLAEGYTATEADGKWVVTCANGCEYTYSDNGDGTHTATCSVCGHKVTEEHSTEKEENKANCQQGDICDLCGTEYGEVGHSFVDSKCACGALGITSVEDWSSGTYPGGWDNETGISGTISPNDVGKTEWVNGDEITVTLNSAAYGTQTAVLTYQDGSFSGDVSLAYAEGEDPQNLITVAYGKGGGTDEYIIVRHEIDGSTLQISNEEVIRLYSRLRLVGTANTTYTVSVTGFCPADSEESGEHSYTLTANSDGNAFLYGTFAEGATLTVNGVTSRFHYLNGTEHGTSYGICAVHTAAEGAETNCMGKKCDLCGLYFGTKDESKHITEKEENKATCTEKAVCDLCGASYGEADPNNHDFSTVDDNGKCGCGVTFVAAVDKTVYSTFADAVANWTDGTTLTLFADVTGKSTINISGKSVTFDMNGHTYSVSSWMFKVEEGASLVITDSSSEGNGLLNYTGSGGWAIISRGNLTFAGGKATSVAYDQTVCISAGTFRMTGGTVENTGGTNALLINGYQDRVTSVLISGGTFSGKTDDICVYDSPMTISGTVYFDSIVIDSQYYDTYQSVANFKDAENADGWKIRSQFCPLTVGTQLILPDNMELQVDTLPVTVLNPGYVGVISHPHSGGNATCGAQAICDICSKPYGTTPAHSFDETGKCSGCGQQATISVTDGTNTYYALDAVSLNTAVTDLLNTGARTFTVNLPATAEAKLFTAIRRALIDTEGVADGSVNLTLAGVTAIPDHDDRSLSTAIFGDILGTELESMTQLAAINLPDVLTIGDDAFKGCKNLLSLTAPKVQTVGDWAFAYTGITELELPEATTLGWVAFCPCEDLTSVKLPKAVSLGQQAFDICESLTKVELTAEGDITFSKYVFENAGNIELVLNFDKVEEVTNGVTWKGYTFKSITFVHADGTTNHSFTHTPNEDGETHKKICSDCGYVEIAAEAHTGGTATCTEKAVCDLCGASYGELDPYNHTDATAVFEWPESYSDYMEVYVRLNCVCGEEVDYFWVYGDAITVETLPGTDCKNPTVATCTLNDEYNGVTYTDTKTYIVPGDPHAGEFVNGFCSGCGGFEGAVWNEEDYVYEIYNAGQLYWYAQELNTNNSEIYVKLMKDIVIPENAPNWEPINASYAYFNGNFHTISGLKCIGGDAQYVGLFGMEGWWYEISNLHIDSSYFEGSGYVGAVVACMTNGGSITNCAVTNTTVQGDGASVGTLAGYMSVGSVVNCFVDANTLAGGYTDGYVTIENSYYLSETETEDGGKTAEQFASGEVAYLLQSGIAEEDIYDEDWNWIGSEQPHVWGQTVGQDAYPVLKGQKVYENLDCAGAVAGYANEIIIPEHSFVQGYCRVCGEPLGDAVLDGVTYVFGGVIPLRWYLNRVEVPTYWVAGDGYVYFDPAAKLMTLDNATVYSELWSSEDSAVYWEDDLVINFSGTNTMSANDHNNGIVISVKGATVMNGIGKDADLNINSGADEAARFGSLTVNSGSVSFVSKDSAHTSVGVSTVALTVAEGAVVNVTAGNANYEYGLSYGMATEKLHVDGTLNASYGFCANERECLSCGVLCTELTGSGTINALMLQMDQENMILNFTVRGKAVLASNWKAMTDEEVTITNTFTVAEGAILTIPEGVTLDLTALPAENISIRGTILNNGTIICNHSVAEDDGDCTTDIPCLICHQPVIAGNDEHDWMDATCTTAKVCSFCGTTEGDALGHGTIEGFEYHQYSDYHEVWCTDCWAYSYQENHTYGEDHYCICGAPEMFTVTFMNGDEVWITDNRYYNTKIAYVGMNYPTKEGYSFSGWYTAEGDPIANGTLVMGDMVLYAGFRINTYNYTVEVYTMDLFGNYGEPVVTTEAAAFGSIVDLTGYQTGEHFYLDGENINSKLYATVPANDDLVMRVYVVRKSYDITWILNGCTVVTEIVSDLPTSLRYSGDLGEYGWHYVNMLLDTPAGYRVVDYVDGNGNSIAKESYNGHDRLKFPVTGDMTIEVVLEKETVDDPVKLETAALSFKEKIHYNIFFSLNLAETVELADMGLILFDSLNADGTMDDAIATYSGAVQMDGKYMVATDGIHAKQMGDTIYFRVYAKLADGSYVYSKTVEYSAVTYAQHILKGAYSDSDKALVVAMLNYGAQAQRYFGYNTENPVNAGLTEEQQALVKGYESDLLAPVQKPDSSKTGAFASTGSGFAKKAPAVSFEGSFLLNYFFTPSETVAGDMTLYYWTEEDYAAATELTAENVTGSIVMTPGAQYHAVLDGIYAKDVDATVYVAAVYSDGTATHCTGVLPYSIGAYLTSHAAKETDFQAMAQAAAVYCSYCKEYFKG